MRSRLLRLLGSLPMIALCLVLCNAFFEQGSSAVTVKNDASDSLSVSAAKEMTEPSFTDGEIEYALENLGFESYSELDELGRCGVAAACLGPETMPGDNEERGSIGMVKPSGWHTVTYDSVDGRYLYNRCHLIGWQLSGENANERNLVTGTRWMNTESMLSVENEVADYIRKTGNHVLYRATPVFNEAELVCRGVLIEALSLEDGGDGISLSVWCSNEQPGIAIDYATGESWEK